MPNWKKLITSGSDASLNSLSLATSLTASIISASSGITGSLFGTSSWAQNALTASFITPTGTNAFVQGGNSFGTTALLGTNDNQNLQLETNGSVRMTISSSGNVGIGTTNPGAKLEIDLDGTGKYLRFNDWSGNYATYGWGITSNIDKFRLPSIVYFGDSSFYFQKSGLNGFLVSFNDLQLGSSNTANGGSKVYLYGQQSTGNVGIGTTSPTSRLQVRGSGATSATTALRVENSNASASLVVLDNNNVGIGTTSPTAKLHIDGDTILSGSLYTYGSNSDIDSGSLRTVLSVSTGSYRAAFFDYVLNKSTNARAGTVFSVWNGTNVEYTETSTTDIGNTSDVNLSVNLSGANVILYASSSTNDWSVKALARMI